MKKLTVLICCIVLAKLITAQEVIKLNVKGFEEKISQGNQIQLMDVRSAEEYNSGHIKGALNNDVNGDDFLKHIAFLDKTKPVYVYCLAGGRSANAANILKEKGFTQVYDLEGGINAWRNGGKPVEGAAKTSPGLSKTDLEKSILGKEKVLLVVSAKWCPPCRKMAPELDIAEKKYSTVSFLRLDPDQNTQLVKDLNIGSFPTLIYFEKGKQVWRESGYMDPATMEVKLK